MSDISINLELDNRKRADGSQFVQIRLTKYRSSKRISTGLSVFKKDWDEKNKEVKRSNPLCVQINAALKAKLWACQKEHVIAVSNNIAITADSLRKKIKKDVGGVSFFEFAKQRIANIDNEGSKGNNQTVVNKLFEFRKKKDLFFDDFTIEFIRNYQKHLVRLGNSVNTVHNNLKTLKAIYNEAVETEAYIPADVLLWKKIKLKKEATTRAKLTENQVNTIEALDLDITQLLHHTRNVFLFSIFMQGIRINEALQMTWANVIDGRLQYKASKGDKERDKKIIPRAHNILEQYRKPDTKPTDFIFPFLQKHASKKSDKQQWHKAIKSATSQINANLQELALQIGVRKISSHVARHTFANLAIQKSGGNIHLVSDALNHSSIKITEQYLADATTDENDNLIDKMF